jgi:hypothetical protein
LSARTADARLGAAEGNTMTTVHGLRITLDGTLEDVEMPRESGRLANALNAAIGSDLFDLVGLEDDIDLFVDDEGMYRSEPNPALSLVARRLGNQQSVLFGAGVFLRGHISTGENHSLTDTQRDRITTAYRIVRPLTALFGVVIVTTGD